MRRVRRHPVLHTSHQPEALCTENVIELIFSRYWYDDPANKTNGEFDVVTHNPHGYVFYEAKFRSMPDTRARISKSNNLTTSSIANGASHATSSMRQSIPHRQY